MKGRQEEPIIGKERQEGRENRTRRQEVGSIGRGGRR